MSTEFQSSAASTINEQQDIPTPILVPRYDANSTSYSPMAHSPATRGSSAREARFRRRKITKSSVEHTRFLALNKWEGAVVECFATYFVAEVIDMDTDESATVEFNLSDLHADDVELCEPGALFYWSIGYQIKPGGQRVRSSVLRFRRVRRAS